ncbi:hypothetical protein IQ235_17370 [Oscillatoriales cyanobacterium LEGE 11467]|uniref:Uncharacterized protein n=1 Tax=Zarconia navalis LEGE 11467 TaxID=1828826 RepID=A0A928W0B0_9CYAN|nr:hypothetical protein [Zarconia navalis]MBE9042543.1 hypothetical protein [Zarconia navalis LEGE 11467]
MDGTSYQNCGIPPRGASEYCRTQVAEKLPEDIIPGVDLSASVRGMLTWLGHYGRTIRQYSHPTLSPKF